MPIYSEIAKANICRAVTNSAGLVQIGSGNMLSRLLSDKEESIYNENNLDLLVENFRVPALPMIGIHSNMHAMIVSSIIVMLASIWANGESNAQIYAMTRLIPCFFLGVVCGYVSILAGVSSIRMVKEGKFGIFSRQFVQILINPTKILLSISVGLMILSNIIFCISAVYGLLTMVKYVI